MCASLSAAFPPSTIIGASAVGVVSCAEENCGIQPAKATEVASIKRSRDIDKNRPPVPIGLATSTVLREPVVVALPQGHPLASHHAFDLTALADQTFITPRQPADVGFHSNTLEACMATGIIPKVSPIGRDFTTIMSMVAVGLGISLVPKSLQCLQLPGVRYVELSRTHMTDLAIAYRKSEGSAAVRAFIAHHRARYPRSDFR
jgi:DNA-binding transcriptional LysR family regulator